MPSSSMPSWAEELALAYESGAHGQFVIYGNVHDRLAVGDRLLHLVRYLEDELLARFDVVLAYDLGNGLEVVRGGDHVQAWGGAKELRSLPRDPTSAARLVGHYLRYLGNLRALGRGGELHVALLVRGAEQVLPADGTGQEHGGLVALMREWASESPFRDLPFATLLIADNVNDLDPRVAFDPRVARVRVPLPDAAALAAAIGILRAERPAAFPPDADVAAMAAAMVGVTVTGLESLVRRRAHQRLPITTADQNQAKKRLVERDAGGLVEFVEPRRTLADYHGQEALIAWLRQDVALWNAGDLRALPMGYLICGPVGTGKTFLVECLAGEVGAPVVKLKNFRDRWVGSSEGNLERIFRLVRALGRCIVFVDEADQALGRRDAGSGDSGLSGRLYSMVAQEMGDGERRGRTMWMLASSRPDLIEVDLKRPGRIDVKVPLLPTTTAAESAGLLGALARRYDLGIEGSSISALGEKLPLLLTPGAAEALIVKTYRLARTHDVEPLAALDACLDGYQNPVPADVLDFQMRIAVREASDLTFVPPSLRQLATSD
ncbi:MAG: AAA family ATPase [Chromatiales bacterium]|nr:AAA family ATPase [Chromatiales bacterium]